MKKLTIIFLTSISSSFTLFLAPISVRAQETEKCYCPPLKIYIYDTKIDFPLSKTPNAVEAGEYVEVQNSGDWLEGAYLKQQTEEFKVYKGIRPGADSGTTYEPPPANGGISNDEIDFNSYAEISRSGDSGAYVYSVTVNVTDAYTGAQVSSLTQTTTDLGKADDLIDANVSTFSPVPDKLRDYQKKVRDQSGGTKWIGLKWKATPEKTLLKKNEKTSIKINVFDCADEKPAPTQELHLILTSEDVGTLNVRTVTTNASGEATVIFTAKKEGVTQVLPNFLYTAVNGVPGWHGLECTDQKSITVIDNNLAGYWLFTYTCTQSSEETWKSAHEDHTKKSNGSGSGYVVIDAPPEQDGYVIISTEQGDPVIRFTVSGTYNYSESGISTDLNNEIEEKRIINYSGKPHQGQGLGFEYNSKDKGDQGGIQDAGISFDITGTDEIWNRDSEGKLRSSSSHADEASWAGIELGSKNDKVTKIKNGFAIDYHQSKDTSYPDALGREKHTLKKTEQYHAELIRVPKK